MVILMTLTGMEQSMQADIAQANYLNGLKKQEATSKVFGYAV
jgi:hypothetical protein